jgi:GH15 family glucan-1,4-alpha-glucosidase
VSPTGLLTAERLSATADTIVALQLPTGMIPWFEGGHADPWNHVEALMALSESGRFAAAEAGYEWLLRMQQPSGAWASYYVADGIEDPRNDTNVCAYVATGTWNHYLATGDRGFLETMWPVVQAAIDFVLGLQQPGGEVTWNVDAAGVPGAYALLTGSSSIYLSLRCAVATAEELGAERPEWELAAGRLRYAIAHREMCFEPKHRYSMDWYYPVLSGAVTGTTALERLAGRWDELVMDGLGVLCVSDSSWVTTAETAECAIACAVAGRFDAARDLLSWIDEQRQEDGSYLTGTVYPQRSTFPRDERTTYSAAAMILATRALAPAGPADVMLLGADLPCGYEFESDSIGDHA